MDVNYLRIAVTLLSFACFAGIVAWACSHRNRRRFDEAAMLPFAGEAPARPADRLPLPAAREQE